jgi:hypothetical protein
VPDFSEAAQSAMWELRQRESFAGETANARERFAVGESSYKYSIIGTDRGALPIDHGTTVVVIQHMWVLNPVWARPDRE